MYHALLCVEVPCVTLTCTLHVPRELGIRMDMYVTYVVVIYVAVGPLDSTVYTTKVTFKSALYSTQLTLYTFFPVFIQLAFHDF